MDSNRQLLAQLLFLDGPDKNHYNALGRFITAYSAAEEQIHLLARSVSGLSDDRARIVFSGMRLIDIIDRIRALMKTGEYSEEDIQDTEDCLTQLNVISARRHNLVHRQVRYENGNLRVTNIQTAKSILQYDDDTIGLTDILNMLHDAMLITIRLTHVRNPEYVRDVDPGFRKAIRVPWLYKPEPPKNPSKPRRKDRRSRGSPPPPSPE